MSRLLCESERSDRCAREIGIYNPFRITSVFIDKSNIKREEKCAL